MVNDEEWDLISSNRIIRQYKELGRKFSICITSDNYQLKSIKDTPTDSLICELNFRNEMKKTQPLVSEELIKIIEEELLYRRKAKINKIQKNILKKQNIFVYFYHLIKKLWKHIRIIMMK